MPTYNMEEGGLAFRFNKSRAKIQVYGGGFGNGKTAGLCIKAIQVAQGYPGANLLLARETYPKLNDTLRKEFYKWVPKASIRRWPTKDDNTLYMANGTTINFRYVAQRGKTSEDGQTTSNLLSATYDFIGIDQMEDPGIVEKDFFDLMGRLRGTAPYRGDDPSMPSTGPRWLVLTCNPTSNWFYRRVIKPLHLYLDKGLITDELLIDERTKKPILELYEGATSENEANLPDDFITGLRSTYHGQMYDRYFLGKWAAYEGLIYPQFKEEVHMVLRSEMLKILQTLNQSKRFKIKGVEGYDFGIASPSCYLAGFIDEYGRIFIIDGFYKPELSIEEQASKINEIRARYLGLIEFGDPISADPDLFKRKIMPGYKSLGDTIANKFRTEFGIHMRPGDNAKLAGIAKVSAYLNQYKNLPSFYPKEESALIYFASELHFVQDEFNNYFWKVNTLGQREDEPIDRNDHALDAVKYILSFRPKPGDLIRVKQDVQPAWMFWHEVDDAHVRPTTQAF